MKKTKNTAMAKHFRALVFDLDGTIVDSTLDIAAAVNRMRETHGLPALAVADIRAHLGDGASVLIARCLQEFPDRVPSALQSFREDYGARCLEKTTLYPGVREGLAILARSYGLAVLSNKDRAMSVNILEGLGLGSLFGAVVGGDGPCLKPCPDGLLSVLETLQVRPEEALMVGDHHTDLEAANRAGTASAFCDYGYGNDGGLVPDIRLASFQDLIRVLAEC